MQWYIKLVWEFRFNVYIIYFVYLYPESINFIFLTFPIKKFWFLVLGFLSLSFPLCRFSLPIHPPSVPYQSGFPLPHFVTRFVVGYQESWKLWPSIVIASLRFNPWNSVLKGNADLLFLMNCSVVTWLCRQYISSHYPAPHSFTFS